MIRTTLLLVTLMGCGPTSRGECARDYAGAYDLTIVSSEGASCPADTITTRIPATSSGCDVAWEDGCTYSASCPGPSGFTMTVSGTGPDTLEGTLVLSECRAQVVLQRQGPPPPPPADSGPIIMIDGG